ncbi:MAG: 50S ribosomal protein L4 [Actinobacteria bacterium]|nr:50S ribosomal protein L4 [Actinomycetota bacterium]
MDTPQDLTVEVRTPAGKSAGKATLAGAVFGIKPNAAVMHQVVTAQLAAARAGTHSTKTRAEVRGGGAKPYRQKGTGRARQGSTRSPHWRGGGVAHGPKPRDYSQRTPKKMVKLALRSALSDRAADGKVLIVGEWGFEAPKTKEARLALDALGIAANQRALVVIAHDDETARRSFRNLAGDRRVQVIEDGQLNAYEVLVADWVVFTQATLDAVTARLSGAGASASSEAGSEGQSTPPTEEGGEEQ